MATTTIPATAVTPISCPISIWYGRFLKQTLLEPLTNPYPDTEYSLFYFDYLDINICLHHIS